MCAPFSAPEEQICLLCTKVVTKKSFKRKLTKACLNLELIAGKKISSGEGSLLTTILCRNCADKNETVGRKILARLARFSDAYSLYTSPYASNSLKWLKDAFRRHKKDTTQRGFELSVVAFQRKKEIVFVRNLNPYRLLFQPLIIRFGYQWLRYFEQEHAALVKLGSKRVYVSVSVKHNCTRFCGISRWSLPWLKIVNSCPLSCDWRWLATCVVNSEFAVARCDMYS